MEISSEFEFNDISKRFFLFITCQRDYSPNNLFLDTKSLSSYFQNFFNISMFNEHLVNSVRKFSDNAAALTNDIPQIDSASFIFVDQYLSINEVINNSLSSLIDTPLANTPNLNFDSKNYFSQKFILSEKEFEINYKELTYNNYFKFNDVNILFLIEDSQSEFFVRGNALMGNTKMETDLLFQIICRHVKNNLHDFLGFENWTIRTRMPSAVDFILDEQIKLDCENSQLKFSGLLNLFLSSLPDDLNEIPMELESMKLEGQKDEMMKDWIFHEVNAKCFNNLDQVQKLIEEYNIYWDMNNLDQIYIQMIKIGCLFKNLSCPQKIVRARKLALLFFEKIMFNEILVGVVSNFSFDLSNPNSLKLIKILIIIFSLFRFTLNHSIYSSMFTSMNMNKDNFESVLANTLANSINKLSEGFYVDYQILICLIVSIVESFPNFSHYASDNVFLKNIFDYFSLNKDHHSALKICSMLMTFDFNSLSPHQLETIQSILVMFLMDYKEIGKSLHPPSN